MVYRLLQRRGLQSVRGTNARYRNREIFLAPVVDTNGERESARKAINHYRDGYSLLLIARPREHGLIGVGFM